MPEAATTLLCVCNYPANTGYAWDFIESIYARLAVRMNERGHHCYVAYPRIDSPPRTLHDSPADPVTLDATCTSWRSIVATMKFVRRNRVAVIYLTDGRSSSPAYVLLRLAGLRSVVVHSHWSGPHRPPTGWRRYVKWIAARVPAAVADVVVTVSDYVAVHHVESGMVPRHRVVRVWNGMAVTSEASGADKPIHRLLGLADDRPVIVCACRAAKQKGVTVLVAAFAELVAARQAAEPMPALVYMGDGPDFDEIRKARDASPAKEHIYLTGYRTDAAALLAGADICALPSIAADALPLAVMHPMALGRPVVASSVGGVPEMVIDGTTGILVPPGDVGALSSALQRLLRDPALAASLGRSARIRIQDHFAPYQQIDALTGIVCSAFGMADVAR